MCYGGLQGTREVKEMGMGMGMGCCAGGGGGGGGGGGVEDSLV